MEKLRRTPLYEEHLKLNAKMVAFAGWEMPIQYTSVIDEHLNVRNRFGIFDVSHMGEIEIEGPDALEFADYLVTNSIKDMKIGKVKYTPMCYPDGGEVDDLFVYYLKEDFVLLVVNASNYEKDLKWILDNKADFRVEVRGKTEEYGEVAIQGPGAEGFLKQFFEGKIPLEELAFFSSAFGSLFGANVLISRTGYTGEDGFEVYAAPKEISMVWKETITRGASFGVKPAGLGARDTLRFEVAYWLYGNDIDATTNPFEAGQGFAVKLKKERFIGKEAIEKVKLNGISRKLVGLKVLEGGIPRHGMELFRENERVGYVTSGNYSPVLKEILALGYVDINYAEPGTDLEVSIRGKKAPCKVVQIPFVQPRAGKKAIDNK